MKKWRFIDTAPCDCYRNMAIDEALLETYGRADSLPVFRLYGWDPPAFSIGISQDAAIELDIKECEAAGINFVRRITGGGVIFHDKEITYSMVCSQKDIGASILAKETYKILCVFLIEAYKAMGLDAGFFMDADKVPRSNWACFGQRQRYDIIAGGRKIGGNAQKRKHDLIFQHGSIPISLNLDAYSRFSTNRLVIDKEKTVSLSQAIGRQIKPAELKKIVSEAFKKSFDAELVTDSLTVQEKKLRDYFLKNKYCTSEWNMFKHVNKTEAIVA